MKIKYPFSFAILFASLVLTALLTVTLHSILVWLAFLDLGLIAGLRYVAHSEVDGWMSRFRW